MADDHKTFLDTAGIARLFGVCRRTVTDRWAKLPGFPAPARNINRRSKWWRREDVEVWAAKSASS